MTYARPSPLERAFNIGLALLIGGAMTAVHILGRL